MINYGIDSSANGKYEVKYSGQNCLDESCLHQNSVKT